MSELAKRVKYPDYFFYLIEFEYANPRKVRRFFDRYPDLAGEWPDLSEYDSDDLDEMDAFLKKLRLVPLISDHTKAVPEPDDGDAA